MTNKLVSARTQSHTYLSQWFVKIMQGSALWRGLARSADTRVCVQLVLIIRKVQVVETSSFILHIKFNTLAF